MNISTKKPHLAFVVTEDWYFWSHRVDLARAARDKGYKVTVLSSQGRLEEQIRNEGFDFHPARISRKSLNPLYELLTVLHLFWLFIRLKPDIVHLVALKPISYGSAAAWLARVPAVVCTFAGLGYVFSDTGLKVGILRGIITTACRLFVKGRNRVRVIVQNRDDMDQCIRDRMADARQIELVRGSGVDTTRFAVHPEPEGTPVILCHSRMLKEKGIGELVQAADVLAERGVEFKLCLVGDPDDDNPAAIDSATLHAWNEKPYIDWLGRRSDIPELLAASHVASLPSYYREGIPLSLLEAASSGRTVVTTDAPGCREVVEDGVSGLLVPVKEIVPLADALQQVLENAELRQSMGSKARERVEALFAKEIILRDTLAIYTGLTGL